MMCHYIYLNHRISYSNSLTCSISIVFYVLGVHCIYGCFNRYSISSTVGSACFLTNFFGKSLHQHLSTMMDAIKSYMDAIKSYVQHVRSDKILLAYNLSFVGTLLLPLIFFVISRVINSGEGDEREEDQWWNWWGEGRDPEAAKTATVVFVYVWTFALIALLTHQGTKWLDQGKLAGLRTALFAFAHHAFICCVLIVGLGVIDMEGREAEATGWFGQSGVLLLLTCIFGMISSLAFVRWLYLKGQDADDKSDGFVSIA